MLSLELPLLHFLFLPWCHQILASDMTVQYPPPFHLNYVASYSRVISLLFSLIFRPSFFLFLSVLLSWGIYLIAVCNTAESVVCLCVLTTCISGSSFLSTHSTSFVISTAWAASNCIRPLPPCFLGTYNRSTSAFGWCCPWMVSSFLVFRSSFCSSSWCQLTIPKLYLILALSMIQLLEFYSLHLILYPQLVSLSSSVPSSTLSASSNNTSNDLPRMQNQRLLVQFWAPDDGRCVARSMLSFI